MFRLDSSPLKQIMVRAESDFSQDTTNPSASSTWLAVGHLPQPSQAWEQSQNPGHELTFKWNHGACRWRLNMSARMLFPKLTISNIHHTLGFP